MKNILIVASSIALFLILLLGGCRALIYTIANSNTCERFNIDNIEVRTGIDIPSVMNVDCMYENGLKNVTFTLDTSKVKIEEYLNRNKFIWQDSMYINNGERERTKWHAEYRKELAALKMKIVYKDVTSDS